MPERDDLLDDLHELGRSVPTPPAEGMDAAVLARLDGPSVAPRPRYWMRAVAIGVTILVALLLAPPVRAGIADWFGFGAVKVREDDGSTGAGSTGPPQPSATPGTSLEAAAAQVTFEVFELPGLGTPLGAGVSADRRILSTQWRLVRLDQSSSTSYTFGKTAAEVERVLVNGSEALWFPDSHDVTMIGQDGSEVPSTRRPAGRTLIWTIGDTTLRLEGDLTLARAVALAEGARALE
ncbi:MAG TPA: hypothetical protein VFO49_19605 [Nocardioides sp.]|nr:hypothetical protein [Nocardioides sp.]